MGNLRGALNAVLLLVLCTCYVDVARGQRTDPNEVNALKAIKDRQLFKMNLSGTLAPEVGLLSQLKTLTLNGNQLSGSLPEEIGYLRNLDRLQIDQNDISGPIPKSFANLTSVKHLQADNNNLSGSSIPEEYSKIQTLLKLDLSWNQLNGPIPTNRLASNITTMSVERNRLDGAVPPNIWSNITFTENRTLILYGILRMQLLAGWQITLSDVFGPYELLNFTLGSYEDEFPTTGSSGLKKSALAGILVGAIVAAIVSSVTATIFIMKKRTKRRTISRRSLLSRFSIKVDGVKCFTFEEMALATSDFTAQIGQGGYGKVYKGNLADGTAVAIKRAHEDSLQGSKEFCTEIELLSRLHHRNLVSLIGYCDEEDEQVSSYALNYLFISTFEIIFRENSWYLYLPLKENRILQMLVYEFMPNATLRDHLSAKTERPLSFGRRLHIALGAAKGILYLHTEANPPIFHRDVKASNILLDSKFVAKVADFGLSRLAPVPDIEGTLPAHISTVVKGTPGYLDPEYFLTHKLTERSDVYSLGVVFLELFTGMKPIQHGRNLVREVNTAYQSGDISKIIDSRMSSCPPECATRFLSLAIKCCHDETEARPYMVDIVRELETILGMMPEGENLQSETTETSSGALTKSMSSSTTTGALFVSSHTSGSDHVTNSGIPSGTVAPR
ncbi:hypothetical protein PR202_ga09235 [Eleusine coracana subsp. coracana]|uniref:non-specific serine/threonine protein kinase n=1 Tax=Eleusine coracana subsp. coracana TaxID=191504 RepID=A0AAV5C393_ELECO|nr:hypothetical protein PR202_ga09235 [Eleusine coracana subsp. coracana]